MTIIYRTAGAWGAGKGSNLTSVEVDNNFYDLATRVLALEDTPPALNEISNITVTGGQFTVWMEDGSSFGPFNLPVAVFSMRGAWVAATNYDQLDLVTISTGVAGGLYLVLQTHTAASTFDPARQISGSPVYHLVLPNTDNVHILRTDVDSQIHGLTEKTVPEDTDEVVVEDSSNGYAKKRVKMSSIVAGSSSDTGVVDFKDSVRVVSTSPITLAGAQTVDGVALVEGDSALVAGQDDANPHPDNGLYDVHDPGAWTRRNDADTSPEVTAGMLVFVEEGTLNANRQWVLVTSDPIVLGTTPLQFRRSTRFLSGFTVGKRVLVDNYTLILFDTGRWLRRNTAGPNTTTVPPYADVPIPVHSEIFVQWQGAGATSIVAGAGVTIHSASGLDLPAQYSVARLKKQSRDVWSLDFPPAVSLGDLLDVELPTSPADGDIIRYNASSGMWEAVSGASSVSSLDDLTDVAVPSPSDGEVLTFNGSSGQWESVAGGASIPLSYLDTDGTLAANSDVKVATQKAVRTYFAARIAALDIMSFKGVIDCSANPNYPAADAGDTYRISVAGKIGGASGITVEAGDMILAIADGLASANQATVGTSWEIFQANIVGLGDAAFKNTGTSAGTVMAGDDTRVVNPVAYIFAGGVFTANEVVFAMKFARAWSLPASLTGSYATLLIAATASTTITLKKNGSSIGTLVFAISGTVATITFASPVSFAVGDILTVVAPASPDATAAGLYLSLLGG